MNCIICFEKINDDDDEDFDELKLKLFDYDQDNDLDKFFYGEDSSDEKDSNNEEEDSNNEKDVSDNSSNVKHIDIIKIKKIHNKCKKDRLYFCKRCDCYSIKYQNDDPNDDVYCEYFVDKSNNYFHKECFTEHKCYDCSNTYYGSGRYYTFVDPIGHWNSADIIIKGDKTAPIHLRCRENYWRICWICEFAEARIEKCNGCGSECYMGCKTVIKNGIIGYDMPSIFEGIRCCELCKND